MSNRATKYYWFGGAIHVYLDYTDETWWVALRAGTRVYVSIRLWRRS